MTTLLLCCINNNDINQLINQLINIRVFGRSYSKYPFALWYDKWYYFTASKLLWCREYSLIGLVLGYLTHCELSRMLKEILSLAEFGCHHGNHDLIDILFWSLAFIKYETLAHITFISCSSVFLYTIIWDQWCLYILLLRFLLQWI